MTEGMRQRGSCKHWGFGLFFCWFCSSQSEMHNSNAISSVQHTYPLLSSQSLLFPLKAFEPCGKVWPSLVQHVCTPLVPDQQRSVKISLINPAGEQRSVQRSLWVPSRDQQPGESRIRTTVTWLSLHSSSFFLLCELSSLEPGTFYIKANKNKSQECSILIAYAVGRSKL